ncbi:MAG: hypothetical protein AMS27_02040 [Bacteroides sp. SM23_62_1]|nr:MAG: hypothetical protein AMS27_02040 [Bacteroides sp. SM23_62_1]
MTKKIHKLIIEDDYRFLLVGISSHENDYRLCWAINTNLGMSLKRSENLKYYHPRIEQDQEFSVYQYKDQETLLQYFLISNRCEDGFLLEEMSNIDYIMKITGDADKNLLIRLINRLKKINIITTAFEINAQTLKSRKKLLF